MNNKATGATDPSGLDSLYINPLGFASWTIEQKRSFAYFRGNEMLDRIEFGQLRGDSVVIHPRFGGGTAKKDVLERDIENFWNTHVYLRGYSREYQIQRIQGFLSRYRTNDAPAAAEGDGGGLLYNSVTTGPATFFGGLYDAVGGIWNTLQLPNPVRAIKKGDAWHLMPTYTYRQDFNAEFDAYMVQGVDAKSSATMATLAKLPVFGSYVSGVELYDGKSLRAGEVGRELNGYDKLQRAAGITADMAGTAAAFAPKGVNLGGPAIPGGATVARVGAAIQSTAGRFTHPILQRTFASISRALRMDVAPYFQRVLPSGAYDFFAGANRLLRSDVRALYQGFSDSASAFLRALSNTPLPGQIRYGASDLSRAARAFRTAERVPPTRNVAVFEYRAADGSLRTISRSSERSIGHAERIIANELETMGIHPTQVTRIYSELQPCSIPTEAAGCARFIRETFPQAEVTWSFEYGATQASRDAGRAAMFQAIQELNR